MRTRWQRIRMLCWIFVSFSTVASSCDASGIGAFDRTATAQYAVRASIDPDGHLSIVEQRQVGGRDADPLLAEASDPTTLRDPFDYDPDPGMTYLMLIAPSVAAHQDHDADKGQYSLLYLHEPETDLPSQSFPTGGIHGDLSPEEFLNCLRSETSAATRFGALAAAVDDPESDLLYECI